MFPGLPTTKLYHSKQPALSSSVATEKDTGVSIMKLPDAYKRPFSLFIVHLQMLYIQTFTANFIIYKGTGLDHSVYWTCSVLHEANVR